MRPTLTLKLGSLLLVLVLTSLKSRLLHVGGTLTTPDIRLPGAVCLDSVPAFNCGVSCMAERGLVKAAGWLDSICRCCACRRSKVYSGRRLCCANALVACEGCGKLTGSTSLPRLAN